MRLFSDYYNAIPDGVVNDRWHPASFLTRAMKWSPVKMVVDWVVKWKVHCDAELKPMPTPHCDMTSPEYTTYPDVQKKKWECVRGMDKSFGYNHASLPGDFLSRDNLSHSLVDIVSKNGNLLINVGPRGEDAVIPDTQSLRLDWLGHLTRTYGEALFGTRPWKVAEGKTLCGLPVRFTCNGSTLFAWLLGVPSSNAVVIAGLSIPAGTRVRWAGGIELKSRMTDSGLQIDVGEPAKLPDLSAHALALPGTAEVARLLQRARL